MPDATAFVVLNHESFQDGGNPAEDERLLRVLSEAFHALQDSVAIYDRTRLKARVTDALYEIVLPSGAQLFAGLSALERTKPDEAKRLRSILTSGPPFCNEDGGVEEQRAPIEVALRHEQDGQVILRHIPALRAAWALRGIAWSADRPGWRRDLLPMQVRDESGDEAHSEELVNVYRSEIKDAHKSALERHLTVLPEYEDPGIHNPNRPEHKKYRHEKSLIPRYAELILQYAVPEEGGTTWWARCAHRFYHRFRGALRGGRLLVHWNGTTNPKAMGNQPRMGKPTIDQDVPAELMARLDRNAAIRALGDSDCGCRELAGPGKH